MPPVVAAVAAALAVSEAMAVYVIVMGVVMLASLAYSAYMMASMDAPKEPDANRRNQTVRSSVQPHRMIYGECMTGGALIYAQSHDSLDYDGNVVPNGYITLVVAFTGHEVEEISEVWFNDKISTDLQFKKYVPFQPEQGYWQIDASNPEGVWVVTRPEIGAHIEEFAAIERYRGTPDQEASPFLCSLPPKPTTIISQSPDSGLNDLGVYHQAYQNYYGIYTGQGMCIFTITIIATGDNDTFKWVQQKYADDGTTLTQTASGELTMNGTVQELAEGVKIAFGTFNQEKEFTPSVTGHSLGQTWEIRAFDGAPWTTEHRLRGRSYVVVTLENSDTAFPNGLPNIRALIKGNNQIYDPRTGTTGYTDNWALCVRDYLAKPYGLGATDDEINATSAIAAANICDELVGTKEGGYVRQRGRIVIENVTYQKRYTLNGSFTVDKTPTAIMSEILATAYGAITWTQGQYRILPAAYYPPDPDFYGMNPAIPGLTESDLRGPIKVRPRASMKDRFNAVKGTYISPETWQPVDFPIVKNALYKAEDGGEEITRDVQLTYVTDSRMAQRIAKIMLEKSRQGITVDFPAKWSAFPLAVGDNVPITIAQLGWSQKIFTVKDWKLNPEGGVDLQLQEEAEGCYAWDSGEETTCDLAPDTLLPDPRYTPTPTGLAVGEELYRGNVASVVKSRAVLTWNGTGARQYEINYLPPNNTIWAPLPFTTDTTCLVDDVIPGEYSFRVRGMNALGAWSDWATATATMHGKISLPANVTIFNATFTAGNMIALTWEAPAAADLSYYEIRQGASWADGEVIRTRETGTDWQFRPSGSGTLTFWLKCFDTTGHESAAAISAAATVPAAAPPTAIMTTPLVLGIGLAVTYARTHDIDYCEIWSSLTNNRGEAQVVGITRDGSFSHRGLGNAATRYYWARAVNVFGESSAWYPLDSAAGVSGSTMSDPAQLLQLLNDDITSEAAEEYLLGNQTLLGLMDTQNVVFDGGAADPLAGGNYTHHIYYNSSQILTVAEQVELLATDASGNSSQIDLISDLIGLKIHSDGGQTAGVAIGWSDEEHTKSNVTVLTDTFRVAKADGTGVKTVFGIGEINGVESVGIYGDLIVDGAISARHIAGESLTISVATSATGKRVVLDSTTNEASFYGDRGDGTVERLLCMGDNTGYSNAVLSLGSNDLTRYAIVATNSGLATTIFASNIGNGGAIEGVSTSGYGVVGAGGGGGFASDDGGGVYGVGGTYGGTFGKGSKGAIRLLPSGQPVSPDEGSVYYDNTSKHFFGWNGTSWKQLDN